MTREPDKQREIISHNKRISSRSLLGSSCSGPSFSPPCMVLFSFNFSPTPTKHEWKPGFPSASLMTFETKPMKRGHRLLPAPLSLGSIGSVFVFFSNYPTIRTWSAKKLCREASHGLVCQVGSVRNETRGYLFFARADLSLSLKLQLYGGGSPS